MAQEQSFDSLPPQAKEAVNAVLALGINARLSTIDHDTQPSHLPEEGRFRWGAGQLLAKLEAQGTAGYASLASVAERFACAPIEPSCVQQALHHIAGAEKGGRDR